MVRKAEDAALFGVSRPTLRKWVARGSVPEGTQIDGTRLWLRDDPVRTARRLTGYVEGQHLVKNPCRCFCGIITLQLVRAAGIEPARAMP